MRIPKIISIEREIPHLVVFRAHLEARAMNGNKSVFFTISPWAKGRHNVERTKEKMVGGKRKMVTVKARPTYECMSTEEQFEYLERYVREVYISLLDPEDVLMYVYEMNSSNLLHVHGLLCSHDLQDDVAMKFFQHTVKCDPMTQANMPPKSNRDYCNNIVFCDSLEKTFKYLSKDQDIKKRFPDKFHGNFDN